MYLLTVCLLIKMGKCDVRFDRLMDCGCPNLVPFSWRLKAEGQWKLDISNKIKTLPLYIFKKVRIYYEHTRIKIKQNIKLLLHTKYIIFF